MWKIPHFMHNFTSLAINRTIFLLPRRQITLPRHNETRVLAGLIELPPLPFHIINRPLKPLCDLSTQSGRMPLTLTSPGNGRENLGAPPEHRSHRSGLREKPRPRHDPTSSAESQPAGRHRQDSGRSGGPGLTGHQQSISVACLVSSSEPVQSHGSILIIAIEGDLHRADLSPAV